MRNVYRYGHEEPHRLDVTPLYKKLRAEEPVARVRVPYGEEGWLVTRHESVKTVLSDPRFSRTAAVDAGERLPRPSEIIPMPNPLSVDPPEHTRLRRLIAGPFTKRQVRQYRPEAQRIADQLVDDMITAGPPADLVRDFASRLPVILFGKIVGIPESDRRRIRDWAAPVFAFSGYTAEQISTARAELREYIIELAARKRAQPEDDLLSRLVLAQDHRPTVSEEQLTRLLASLLINDSIPNQIVSSVYLLLTHPDQLGWLRAHLSRLPQAVEELLRFGPIAPDAPSGGQGHVRVARTDIELDGVTIPAGDYVLPSMSSANRDEQVFTDPERLDLTRGPNPHIAFGHGVHHCPGAELSRMELQVALGTLLTRLPDLRLAVPVDEVPWKTSVLVRGAAELPVLW